MKHFLLSLQFLTVFPIRIKGQIEESGFGRSLLCFPVVGALIGFVSSLPVFCSLPSPVTAALVLTISIFITGGIHLDGFADVCDGIAGSNFRERILDIMRDSRIGTIGAAGMACILLLKFAIFASLDRDILWKALVVMTTFSRWSMVLACYTSDYARSEGKAKAFIKYAGRRELLIGALFTLLASVLLMGINGLILFVLSVSPVFLFIGYMKKKIGGMTGDTIGAAGEIAEVGSLFFVVALQGIPWFW